MRVLGSIILLISFAGLFACSKSSTDKAERAIPKLESKWNYVANYYSTGGPGSWYQITPVTQWITLQAGGKLSSNLEPFSAATSYELPEPNKIKFYISAAPDGYRLFQYAIDTAKGTLVLSPLNPMCIEGCAQKFAQ